ncbi:NlpC/P60 family protein [Streptomyces sp. BI20]|uniref:C40 family peptidase n=1 Tax=Streptomyces sp. BI20 TaxID=3403460 RepID=UPI003C73B4DF
MPARLLRGVCVAAALTLAGTGLTLGVGLGAGVGAEPLGFGEAPGRTGPEPGADAAPVTPAAHAPRATPPGPRGGGVPTARADAKPPARAAGPGTEPPVTRAPASARGRAVVRGAGRTGIAVVGRPAVGRSKPAARDDAKPARPVGPGPRTRPGAPDSPGAVEPVEPVEPPEAAEGFEGVDSGADTLPPRSPVALPGAAGAPAVTELLDRLGDLYRRVEEAGEAAHAAEARLRTRQAEERKVAATLAGTRDALGAQRALAGGLAREQYRGDRQASGFSVYARVVLSGDPDQALERGRLAGREAGRRAGLLRRLSAAERRADGLATAARKALDAERTAAAEARAARTEVTTRLKEVERLLASLGPERVAGLERAEEERAADAQRALLASGRLTPAATVGDAGPADDAAPPLDRAGFPVRSPSAAGGAALAYAVRQLGDPYEWGAVGPDAWDCSGLTSRAWERAGRTIPRTSQEQWARLPRVPLDRLRPGDLVVYFPQATHVGLYLGGGRVLHAPRPGGRVKVSPLAANPVLGAVRPDGDAAPLARWTAPALPTGTHAASGTATDADRATDTGTPTAAGSPAP